MGGYASYKQVTGALILNRHFLRPKVIPLRLKQAVRFAWGPS